VVHETFSDERPHPVSGWHSIPDFSGLEYFWGAGASDKNWKSKSGAPFLFTLLANLDTAQLDALPFRQ
jgi:hypothetical protein